MAGTLAGELAPHRRATARRPILGAMFQNLGRLLTEFYFPEEARQIRAHARRRGAGRERSARATLAVQVLGMSYEDLGVGVAQAWGLPDTLQRCMRAPRRRRRRRAAADDGADRTALARPRGANAMTDALLERRRRRLRSGRSVARPSGTRAVLGVSARAHAGGDAGRARAAGAMAQAMNLQVAPGAAGAAAARPHRRPPVARTLTARIR